MVVLACIACVNCARVNNETLTANERIVENFVASILKTDTTFKLILANRVSYIRMKQGDSIPITAGDSIYFYFAARTFYDTVPYETNIKELARRYRMDTTIRSFEPLGVVLGQGDLIPGLENGLLLGYPKDEAAIIFNSDLGYGSKPMGIVPIYSPLYFYVNIIKVTKR